MARPLRIEFNDALYHVTARGDRREPIFEDDDDRLTFLKTLAEVIHRFNWVCPAYCLMDNHYHLMIQTPDGNLSKGMRQLNGVFTQASNRKHRRSGHLFQGRFKAILVDSDGYLLTLARYIVLNPVRVGLVKHPEDYRWSSYQATLGLTTVPWLSDHMLLGSFGEDRRRSRERYQQFVNEGIGAASPWDALRQQIFLGDDQFVTRMQSQANMAGDPLSIPKTQRRGPVPALQEIAEQYPDRNTAIAAAYATGGYSYQQIARFYGLNQATVGRVVRQEML